MTMVSISYIYYYILQTEHSHMHKKVDYNYEKNFKKKLTGFIDLMKKI